MTQTKAQHKGVGGVQFCSGCYVPSVSNEVRLCHFHAAAPDLLAACEAALAHAEIDADDGQLALNALSFIRPHLRAAIAKATQP